jgi:hypothetical protein
MKRAAVCAVRRNVAWHRNYSARTGFEPAQRAAVGFGRGFHSVASQVINS